MPLPTDQPRKPKGTPGGGNWTETVGGRPAGSLALTPESRDVVSSRAAELQSTGYVQAASLNQTLGNTTVAGDDDARRLWWDTQKSLGEYGRPTGDFAQLPDNFTPAETTGLGTDGKRRTHRMNYTGAGVSLRMPSATSIRRFEKLNPGRSFVVPVTSDTPDGPVTGWVQVTRQAPGDRWGARAGGFPANGGDQVGEAVAAILESRRVTAALSQAGDLSARRAARLSMEGQRIKKVTTSGFIQGHSYDENTNTLLVAMHDQTYGYDCTREDVAAYMAASRDTSVGRAYNSIIKGHRDRVEVDSCGKCGAVTRASIQHRCRVKATAGAGAGAYESAARDRALQFASGVRPATPPA
jgi:hypothetical protein